jgi:hypothetical protein
MEEMQNYVSVLVSEFKSIFERGMIMGVRTVRAGRKGEYRQESICNT